MSVRATVQDETTKIQEYIRKMAPKDELLSKYFRQHKPGNAHKEDESSWRDKLLHSMYHCQIEEVADIKKFYQWLEKAGLKDSTKALIMAAQEQALSTRSMDAGVYHTRQNLRSSCVKMLLRQFST